MKVTLTQIEATGIQEYIFGSNNLRQNVGASELVAEATNAWVVECLKEMKLQPNDDWNAKKLEYEWQDGRGIALPEVQVEVIYGSGGNALLLFKGEREALAIDFVNQLTRRAIKEARGLTLVAGHTELQWDSESLWEKHKALRQQIAASKLERPPDVSLPGLAVTAACDFTGLPAVGIDDDERLISRVVRHKLDAFENAERRLHAILPQVKKSKYEFVYDFDLFGEKGESSYLAVIHADGNQMGKRFEAIGEEHHKLAADNAEYVKRLRLLSREVNDKAIAALQATVDLLIRSHDRKTGLFGKLVPVPKRNGQEYLPFRPIVFGGDDVTFVCEGRLGLALAVHYLQELAKGNLSGPKDGEKGEPLFARAGVAVVKSHYPFSRSYELADSLCASAKSRLKELQDKKGVVMDWHFATSGPVRSLEKVREREYVSSDSNGNSLLMRPVWIATNNSKPIASRYWRTWKNFESMVKEFQTAKKWAGRRNKLKALQEALRQGQTAVEQFMKTFAIKELPEISEFPDLKTHGWLGKECGYFDTLEALDFYVPLKKEKKA